MKEITEIIRAVETRNEWGDSEEVESEVFAFTEFYPYALIIARTLEEDEKQMHGEWYKIPGKPGEYRTRYYALIKK